MNKIKYQKNELLVDLADNIIAKTIFPTSHHAALRAGFAGYPPNPRWNVSKFKAWKIGKQWQEDFKQGKMMIHPQNKILILTSEYEEEKTKQNELFSKECFKFSVWAKQIINIQLPMINNQQ